MSNGNSTNPHGNSQQSAFDTLPRNVATVVASLAHGTGVRPPAWLIADVLRMLPPDPSDRQVADTFARLIRRELDRARGKPRDPFLRAMLRNIVGPGGRWPASRR
jgi:hypothetical protein